MKSTNPTILPPALGRLGSLTLLSQPVLEKENFEFKPAKIRLKIDLVLHTARSDGLVYIYIYIRKLIAINIVIWSYVYLQMIIVIK